MVQQSKWRSRTTSSTYFEPTTLRRKCGCPGQSKYNNQNRRQRAKRANYTKYYQDDHTIEDVGHAAMAAHHGCILPLLLLLSSILKWTPMASLFSFLGYNNHMLTVHGIGWFVLLLIVTPWALVRQQCQKIAPMVIGLLFLVLLIFQVKVVEAMEDGVPHVGEDSNPSSVGAVAGAVAAVAAVAPVRRYVLPKRKKRKLERKRKKSTTYNHAAAATSVGLPTSASFMEVYSASMPSRTLDEGAKHSPTKASLKRLNVMLKQSREDEKISASKIITQKDKKIDALKQANLDLSRQLKEEKKSSRVTISKLMQQGEQAVEESHQILREAKEKEKEVELLKIEEHSANCAALRTERRMSSRQKKMGEYQDASAFIF